MTGMNCIIFPSTFVLDRLWARLRAIWIWLLIITLACCLLLLDNGFTNREWLASISITLYGKIVKLVSFLETKYNQRIQLENISVPLWFTDYHIIFPCTVSISYLGGFKFRTPKQVNSILSPCLPTRLAFAWELYAISFCKIWYFWYCTVNNKFYHTAVKITAQNVLYSDRYFFNIICLYQFPGYRVRQSSSPSGVKTEPTPSNIHTLTAWN